MSVLNTSHVEDVFNATFHDVASNATYLTPADVCRTVSFLIFLVVGFTLNCILISIIVQNNEHRANPFNVLIISLATVNLVDCLGNIPSTVVDSNSRRGLWNHDNAIIYVTDCVVLFLVGIVTMLGLLLMATDRLLALRRCVGVALRCPHSITPLVCTRIMAIYSWVHGIILSVPFLFPNLSSTGCTEHPCQSRVDYLWIVAVLGFIIPTLVLSVLYVLIVSTILEQWKTPCQVYTTDGLATAPSPNLPASSDAKYVALLTLAWFIFQVPLLVVRFVVLLTRHHYKLHENVSVNSFELRTALRWLFVAYTLLLPILTFFWKQDAWHKLQRFLNCRKANIVVDSSPLRRTPSSLPLSSQPNPTAIPVLFATAKGLHVQMYDTATSTRKSSPAVSPTVERERTEDSCTGTGTKRCDVFGSFYSGDILSEDGNASDCDSNYDCSFFQIPNTPIVIHSADKTSIDHQTKDKSLEGDKSCKVNETVGRRSQLQLPLVRLGGDNMSSGEIQNSGSDTSAFMVTSTTAKIRSNSDSGQVSQKAANKRKKQRYDVDEISQNKCKDDEHQSITEATTASKSQEFPIDSKQDHKATDRKRGQKRRKQKPKQLDFIDSKSHPDLDLPATNLDLQSDENSNIKVFKKQTLCRESNCKGEADNNSNNALEQNVKKLMRSRHTSESNDNLLDSSSTSSELTILQSTFHNVQQHTATSEA